MYMSSRDLNMGPHTSMANALPTELSPQPRYRKYAANIVFNHLIPIFAILFNYLLVAIKTVPALFNKVISKNCSGKNNFTEDHPFMKWSTFYSLYFS